MSGPILYITYAYRDTDGKIQILIALYIYSMFTNIAETELYKLRPAKKS